MEADAMRSDTAPDRVLLRVDGMSCEHCVAAITTAVRAIPGVDAVQIDLSGGEVVASGTAIATAAVRRAVEEAGYEVV